MKNKFAVWVANAAVLSVLLLGNLLLVNLIGRRVPVRADLTQRNAYTVSDVTRTKLEKVTGELVVTYYVSRETLPESREYRNLESEIVDRLEAFEEHVKGRLRIEVKDPTGGSRDIDEKTRKELGSDGVQPVELEAKFEGKTRRHEFYSSLRILYRGRDEVVNRITDARNLEYKFVGALDHLLETDLPKVGVAFVLSEQEREWKDEIEKRVFGMLGTRADIQRIDLEKGPAEMKDLDVLFVLVRDTVPPAQLYEIDQFVMQGGRLVLCTDVFSHMRQVGQGRFEVFDTGVEGFAEQMGVRLERRLIFDIGNCRKYPTMIPYPDGHEEPGYFYASFECQAENDSFNPDFPIAEDAEGALFWFPHAIRPADPRPEGVEYDYLLRSSERSWQEDVTVKGSLGYNEIMQLFVLGPNAEAILAKWQKDEAERQGVEKGPFRSTIGAVVKGRFKSYFKDKKAPDGVATENYDLADDAEVAEGAGRKTILGSPENRIVFIGDTDWIQKTTESDANRVLLVILTNWLGSDEDYTSELLGKAMPAPPLFDEGDPKAREAFDEKKVMYTFLMVGLSPILLLAFGAWKLVSRYQEKVEQEAQTQRGYASEVAAATAAIPGEKEESR